MITYLKNMEGWKHKDLKSKDLNSIKELFDKAFTRVNMFVDFRTELVEELQSLMEVIPDEEEVAIDVVPLATNSLSIVDWKIHKEGKKSYYQIVRADGKSQMYRVFSQMLKSFTREDLEDLYKLEKAKYGSTKPVEDLDLVLWNDLKIMFEPHVEDEIWKLQQRYKVLSWKLFDSCGVHCLSLQSGMTYMLAEKRYPFTPPTIIDMRNNKLQGRIVRIKSFLMMFGVTAALIDVNAAQSKLMLLENFNENYSKYKFENASNSLNKLIECQIVDNCKKGLGYEKYNAVPPPYTGNFMPLTPDLSFTGLDEFVNKHVVENRKSDEEVSKVVRKSDDFPIIEDWVSDSEEENVSQTKI
ncbi:hypothetical protein Tco_0414617 [Tanacetum coccineum]